MRPGNSPIIFRKMRWVFACVLGLAMQAQAQQFMFRKYVQTDGLTNLATQQLVRAPDGDLWIGTESGLYRYDGNEFTAYRPDRGLPGDTVLGLKIDASGRVWVWFRRGLYIGNAAGFAPVRTAQGPVTPDVGLTLAVRSPDHFVAVVKRRLVEFRRSANGEDWSSGSTFTDTQRTALPALDDIRSAYIDRQGVLWTACAERICSFDGRAVRTWDAEHGIDKDFWNITLEDGSGRLWVRGKTHVVTLERGGTRFEDRSPPAVVAGKFVTFSMSIDTRGRVLLTGVSPSVMRWEGQRWREFGTANGLPRTAAFAVEADADGSLWLSVTGQGLWRWVGYDHFESWSIADGLTDEAIFGIARDAANRLIVGTAGQCQVLDETSRRFGPCPFGRADAYPMVSIARDRDGTMWIGSTIAQLWRMRREDRQATLVSKLGTQGFVTDISLSDDAAWVSAGDAGLHKVDLASGQVQRIPLPATVESVQESIALPDGSRCAATEQGFVHIAGDGSTLASFQRDGNTVGFSSITLGRDGGLWAASASHGLLRASGCNANDARWITAPVVADAHVYFVRADRRGWIWAGTDQGVALFDGRIWRRIDTADGLIWNDLDVNGFMADADGSLWFGTAAGLSHFIDPEGWLAAQAKPLDLQLVSATFGEHKLDLQSTPKHAWSPDTAFKARLASHSHQRSARTEYRYRLVGLSERWAVSRDADIDLPALEPGRYRFEARAVDPDHARESTIVSTSFELTPPWWRTPSLRVSATVALVALLAFMWRRQVLQLHARRTAMEVEYREREALLIKATRDGLTGLWNRSAILEILEREVAQSQRSGLPMAIAMLDVDHFKRVNDTYGHLGGDDVLREVAARVTDAVRRTDWIGRYGGEELIAVLPNLDLDGATLPMERLRECIAERKFDVRGTGVAVTLSIGVAWFEGKNDDSSSLIERADAALYEAKRQGRNRVVFAARAQAADRKAEVGS